MNAPDLKVLEAAATWYVQLNDGDDDAARKQAWRTWLLASPEHASAWARVERLQQQWARIPQEAALSGLGAAQAQRRQVLKLLGLLLAASGSTWLAVEQLPYQALLAQQRTSVRERRSLRLDDGSQLELNAGSAVDIRFDADTRLIRLYQGEVLIETARDPGQRPFIVQTANGSVRALGTRFSVRQLEQRTQVGVLQAAVEVRPQYLAGTALRVEAGEQVVFDDTQTGSIEPLPANSAAWVQGMLSVNDCRLGDFISELGRYRPGVLRCAAAVENLKISGAFRIDDTDTVLENLGKSLPVRVRYLTRYWASVEPA
ncbi:FecR domain-containing protein [Pseudomonas putida]|uniref:Iron dicitrate transport regulator FecR n=1 Tax=Pseudomonas putida TaxID=303 RepID=A0A1Q9QZ71_PSEPU|nr:FecR domain-containing protein [Pseudomonas putida]OLS60443.1 hypothetical protein PSEMO_48540 [Pseudomonas putida]